MHNAMKKSVIALKHTDLGPVGFPEILNWSRRQESNLYLALRRHSFYPLNYGETLELDEYLKLRPRL